MKLVVAGSLVESIQNEFAQRDTVGIYGQVYLYFKFVSGTCPNLKKKRAARGILQYISHTR